MTKWTPGPDNEVDAWASNLLSSIARSAHEIKRTPPIGGYSPVAGKSPLAPECVVGAGDGVSGLVAAVSGPLGARVVALPSGPAQFGGRVLERVLGRISV
jgi:hypothetical protein